MNGSDNASGSKGTAQPLPRGVEPSVDRVPQQGEEWPWEAPRSCRLCRIAQQPQASCEHPEWISNILQQRVPGRVFIRQPGDNRVCKHCCYAVLGGHECPWWDLCWR